MFCKKSSLEVNAKYYLVPFMELLTSKILNTIFTN